MTMTADHGTGAALRTLGDLSLFGEPDDVSTELSTVHDPALQAAIRQFKRLRTSQPHFALSLSAVDLFRERAVADLFASGALLGRAHDEPGDNLGSATGPSTGASSEEVAAAAASRALTEAATHAVLASEGAATGTHSPDPERLARLNALLEPYFPAGVPEKMAAALVANLASEWEPRASRQARRLRNALAHTSFEFVAIVRDNDTPVMVDLVLPGTWGSLTDPDSVRSQYLAQIAAHATTHEPSQGAAPDLAALSLLDAILGAPATGPDDGTSEGTAATVDQYTVSPAYEGVRDGSSNEAMRQSLLAAAENADPIATIRALEAALGLSVRAVLKAATIKASSFYGWEKAAGRGEQIRPRRGSLGRLWALVEAVEDLLDVVPTNLERWLNADDARLNALLDGQYVELVEVAITSHLRPGAPGAAGSGGGLNDEYSGGRGIVGSAVGPHDPTPLFLPIARRERPVRKARQPSRARRTPPAPDTPAADSEA